MSFPIAHESEQVRGPSGPKIVLLLPQSSPQDTKLPYGLGPQLAFSGQ